MNSLLHTLRDHIIIWDHIIISTSNDPFSTFASLKIYEKTETIFFPICFQWDQENQNRNRRTRDTILWLLVRDHALCPASVYVWCVLSYKIMEDLASGGNMELLEYVHWRLCETTVRTLHLPILLARRSKPHFRWHPHRLHRRTAAFPRCSCGSSSTRRTNPSAPWKNGRENACRTLTTTLNNFDEFDFGVHMSTRAPRKLFVWGTDPRVDKSCCLFALRLFRR